MNPLYVDEMVDLHEEVACECCEEDLHNHVDCLVCEEEYQPTDLFESLLNLPPSFNGEDVKFTCGGCGAFYKLKNRNEKSPHFWLWDVYPEDPNLVDSAIDI